jgi:1,4-alpha-glucan branching enzyme
MGGPAGAVSATVLDTAVAATLRDTLRLVRFMLVAPTASRVTLAGDFNGWDRRATPLVTERERGVWSVAVALAPGRHRYAFVVDDTGWVTDPATPRAVPDSGRPHSLLTVSSTRN